MKTTLILCILSLGAVSASFGGDQVGQCDSVNVASCAAARDKSRMSTQQLNGNGDPLKTQTEDDAFGSSAGR